MKARVKLPNCDKCRREIYAEAEEAFLKQQYVIYKDMSYTFTVLATVAALSTFYRKHRTPEYIKKVFDGMCEMYDFPEVFGKKLQLSDMMKTLEEECGIDFSKIIVHLETEEEFIESARKGV